MKIAVLHQLDGYEEYPKEKYLSNLKELEHIVNKYPNLINIGNFLMLNNGDMYKIVEIIIGVVIVQIYIIDCD
jgi:hypothetical protein